MFVGRVLPLVVVVGCGRVGFAPLDAEGIDAHDAHDAAGGDGPAGDAASVACDAQDLVLYLRFDETAGTTVADSSGTGNAGVLSGPNGAWVGGQIGGALDFAGSEIVMAGSAQSLDDLGSLTSCTFIQFDAGTPFAVILDKSADGYLNGWNFYTTAARGLGFYSNYGAFKETGSVLPATGWNYACATWDGTASETGIALYLDGVALPSGFISQGGAFASDAEQELTVGRHKNGDMPLDGRLDELRIYGHALSAQEIQAHYECVAGT